MREMRRKDRALPEEEALAVLTQAEYGVLSSITPDGKPYGLPLSFCVLDGDIYFHCALEGQNIDNIEHNRSVSFCAVGRTQVLPDKFATIYESVIATGTIEEAYAGEKQRALEELLRKYSPEFFDKGLKYVENLNEKTRVFRISIDRLTGKARKR